jgi:uncharacterized protein YkwD
MPSKRKNIQKSTKTHKKTANQHPKHFLKVYWPYIPIIAVVVFGMLFGGVTPNSKIDNPATLSYSTEMSLNGLLNSTNAERSGNGLGNLSLNSKLNSSAQAKANDMVSKDYWAHNTPSGQEPWVFFDAASYEYKKAGENLAYGFSTSSATVVGWMNSASHRANILDGAYTEVGFGFANSENFVGTGQETIVVAHYGTPVTPAPAPEPVPAPAPVVQKQSKPQSLPASNTAETPPAEEIVEEVPVETPMEEEPSTAVNSDSPVEDDIESKNITRIQSITGGAAPWSDLVLSIAGFGIVFFWLVKHTILVKRFVLRGEHFVAHHPLLDLTVVVIAAIAVYLSQASGVVL